MKFPGSRIMYSTYGRKVCQAHTSRGMALWISCQKRFISGLKCKIKFFIANTLPLSNLELRPSRAFKFKWATINFLHTICLHIFFWHIYCYVFIIKAIQCLYFSNIFVSNIWEGFSKSSIQPILQICYI